jgi:hypothetical protein
MKQILVFFSILFSCTIFAKNKIVFYEPYPTELAGVIKILKFPGPPNYTSIENGDTDETGPYLILNSPIDIKSNTHIMANDTTEKNVQLVQVVVKQDSDRNKMKEGNNVKISGMLFHALTGHHHARILVIAEKMTIISRKSVKTKALNQLPKEDLQFLDHENMQN